MNPLVSVIMPVYNTEAYLGESLASILGQTYSPIEVICVDDGSTDGSRGVLGSFGERVRIVEHPHNRGIAEARNTGIALARGTFLAFADADDLWDRRKLERQMERLLGDPSLDVSFTMIENFASPDLSERERAERSFPNGPISGQVSGTAVIRRSSFDRVGPLDPSYRVGEFIDWMARARSAGLRAETVDEVLYRRRVHASNTTTRHPVQADYLRIMKRQLDRRRAGGTTPQEEPHEYSPKNV